MNTKTIGMAAALASLALAPPAWADPPAATPAATAADPAKAMPPEDPRVRRGVLANGLRYAVMRAGKPKDGASIRLGIATGSYEESDAERGVAHFVEHMAFRSTRRFPDDSVDGAFAGKGARFGRDLNGRTEFSSTRFQLDLADADETDWSLALQWLRDVADGVVFEAASVDKERGVILAEEEASHSAESTAARAVASFESPNLRSTLRDPIGAEEVLRATTPAVLRGFYERWYRPDNAVVVIVGDLPLDALEAKVKAAFGAWRRNGALPAGAARAPPDPRRGLDVTSLARPVDIDRISACRLGPPDPDNAADPARARRGFLGSIWREALNQRLAGLRADPSNGLIGARIETIDDPDVERVCLLVFPVAGGWARALGASQRELRRFGAAGPTELEVETATDNVRARLRGAITSGPNRDAPELADTLLDAVLRGDVMVEPRQDLRAFDLAVEDLALADVRAAFERDWSGAGPLISIVSPTPPTREAVRGAWEGADGKNTLAA